MFNFLKRKKKVESQSNELIDILVNYIDKAKRLNWDDEEIKQKFKEKNYPNELISLVFEIYKTKNPNRYKEVNMIKKKKEEDEDLELEEEQEEEEQDDSEDTETEEPEKPVKKFVKKSEPEVEESSKEAKLTDEQIKGGFANLDSRVTQLEATLYRLKGI